MALTRSLYDPFTEFDRLFDDAFTSRFRPSTALTESSLTDKSRLTKFRPKMDLIETKDNQIMARFELPGMKPGQVNVDVHNDHLTISGESQQSTETKDVDAEMELGTNFAAKLEPFLLISKSAKGAAAAKLIQDATSAQGVFVFAELIQLPNIQELANSEQHAPFFLLLQLFSYRTYRDYLANKDSLPQLNQAQITKLKHLSIVSLAANRRILPYSLLLQELQMPTIRDLEDLIIDAIYLDILRGKLDQKEQQLEIEYTMGRDLEPGKAEAVLAALKTWASTTASVLSALDNKLTQIASYSAAVSVDNEEHDRVYNATLKDISERQKDTKKRGPLMSGGNTMRGVELADAMDVDEEPRIKGRKGVPADAMIKQSRLKRNRF